MRAASLTRAACGVLVLTVIAAVSPAQATVEAYIPDNAPLTSTNTIPFSSAAYTYMGRVPASLLPLTHTNLLEVAFQPGGTGTGTWTAPNVRIAVGHLPSPLPCPFTFPSTMSIGSFNDLTVIYDSAVQGTFTWNVTAAAWSPMGFATTGTGFIWNGVDDVGFYITFSGASWTGGVTGGFRRAPNGPNTRTYASTYQAATSTACDALFGLYMRFTMGTSSGLFANFGGSPLSGSAPLAVGFTDTSFSSAPGGVNAWAWDVTNDGIDDYFTQNPVHVYPCPGTYSVRLTVGDGMHAPSSLVRTNLVTVAPHVFDMNTAGGGTGDLTVNPVPTPCYPSTVHGYTLISLATAGPVGGGPFLGIVPDAFTITFVLTAPGVGNPIHFLRDGVNYPDAGPLFLPAGTFASLAGLSMDGLQVMLDANSQLTFLSNVDRVTF